MSTDVEAMANWLDNCPGELADQEDYRRAAAMLRSLSKERDDLQVQLMLSKMHPAAEQGFVTELREQIALLSKDAERYRWLRAHSWVDISLIKSILNFGPGYQQTDQSVLDASIDTALAAKGT